MAVPEILFMLLLSSPATAAEPFPVAAAGCLEPLNPGEPLPHLRVRAALRTGDGEVVAETILRLTNGSRVPLEELPLLFPAALFHHPEEDLDDRNFPWRYPGGVSTALCQVVSARVLEGDPGIAEGAEGPCRAVHHLHLTRPLEPGATLTLSLTTRIRPPRRFGTFGVARGMVTLRGGWHPVLPSLEGAGFRIDAGPGPSVVDAEVCPDERTQILLGPVLGPATPGLPAAWSGTLHEPLLLAAAPDLRRTAIQEGTRRVDLVHRSRDPGPGDTEAPGELLQWDWPAEREAGIRRVLRGLLDPFDGLAWTVLVAPLGEALAVPGRETVVISDALYQITDVDLLRRYHDEALAATLLAASQRGQQPLVHPYLALLTGLLIRQRVGGGVDLDAVRRLARKGEILYAIDQFGTDAQIPQEDLFFQRSGSSAPQSREADLAGGLAPAWSAARVVRELMAVRALRGEAKSRGATGAAGLVGEALAVPFCAWLREGYRQEHDLEVSVRRESDRSGEVFSLVEARRTGFDGLPVRVRVVPEDGAPEDLVFEGGREVERWRIPGRIREAVTDPEGLLPQALQRPVQDLRFNDATRQDLKVVFARPWISFSSGERIPTAYVELDLQRRHDLRSAWVLQPRLFPSRAELLVGHRWGLGRLARPNRSTWQLTVGLKAAAGFVRGGSFSPSARVMFYYDDRRALFAPFRGGWAWGYLEGFAGDTLEGWRPALKVGLGGARLFGRRPDLVLALRALADTQFGDAPAWEHLQAGGILGVRGLTIAGFEPDHRLQGSAELRWMPFRSARLSLARTAFLRAMQLVLFSDAAALGERWDAWLDARHLYVSAGLGVRIHADLFGVFPAVLSVDEAVILPVLGKQLAFATLVYFSQSF